MKALLARIQLVGVLVLAPIALFVVPGTFFGGMLPLAVTVWALWLIGIAAGLKAFPPGAAGRVAVCGLLALTALTAFSISWSSDGPAAVGNLTLILTYLGLLLAAGSAFSNSSSQRLAEPTAWLTAVVAACWGLSERIAPSAVHFTKSRIAFGRLLEPIGYWNAMGALAGIGLVLAVGLSADRTRPHYLRLAAVATSPLLMVALWLSFSRGALVATACGLAALIAASRSSSAFRLGSGAVALTIAAAVLCDALPGVRTVTGPIAVREDDALILLAGLVALTVLAVAGFTAETHFKRSSSGPLSRRIIRLALVSSLVLGLMPAAIVVTGSRDSGAPPAATGADAARLQSLESNRSRYWSVALNQFKDSPLTGGGSGSFRSEWQRNENRRQVALNAHSLEIEVLAELGLIGLLALVTLIAGTWTSGTRRRWSSVNALPAASAALAVFLAHSSIDWDWQVPGLMFPVGLLAAGVLFAPRPGFDASESSGLKALAAVMGFVALAWSAHMWEAKALQSEAASMVDSAKVLGWTPRRERYVINTLNEAAWLNPNPLPKAELAIALYDMGRTKAAAAKARDLARANPDWWFGWALVWRFRSGTDPLIALDAINRANELRGSPLRRTASPH